MYKIIKGINLIYGESATGKTTLALQESLRFAKENKRVLYVDTENGFSVERLKQMDDNYREALNKIFLVQPKSFIEQHELIKKLSKFDLIIIDTIGKYYRREIKENLYSANARLNKQMRILKGLDAPIMVLNQVYFDINKNRLRNIGENILKKWVDRIIQLEKNPRKLITNKGEFNFNIDNSGLVF
ncbi:AAA family ATPase [Candidatus Woesearchaeota archaeon]|nr:AAA family ATPase [Candidatus Woesearchaeota archaeon]